MLSIVRAWLIAACVLAGFLMPTSGQADSIFDAMAQAYDNNPDLNAARAALRATDEGVAIAKSGYRPRLSGVGTLSATSTTTDTGFGQSKTSDTSASVGISVNQMLFDGFQTRNTVRAAEADVFSGRENLRATEIGILQAATEAYANLARDQQIVAIRRQNLDFLREQLNAAQARLEVGEGTRTDVSQAQAELAAAEALLTTAVGQVESSKAVYLQIVGVLPNGIVQPSPITAPLPSGLENAVLIGRRENPDIMAAEYAVDSADFRVKAAEGALLPRVDLSGSLSAEDDGSNAAGIQAQISVPFYQGGEASGRVRQAKEILGQRRILVDSARRSVEQNIATSWAAYQAALANIEANQAQLRAANLALDGVIEERKVGQRTTLDVLDAQQTVLNAREALVQTQRNAVVASFLILANIGRLTVPRLGLQVAEYRAEEHYEAVKDKWYGLRTVDGR